MCIGQTAICPLLTGQEQQWQHMFEERKGSLPESVRDKVIAVGLMSADEYLTTSIHLRSQHALFGLSYGDCRPEETAYMKGEIHSLPERDIYLEEGVWEKVVAVMQKHRHDFFLKAVNYSSKPIAWLRGYPEFDRWIANAFGELSIKALEKFIPTAPELLVIAGSPAFPKDLGSRLTSDQLKFVANHRVQFFFQHRWSLSGDAFDSIYEEEMSILRVILTNDEKERIRTLASESVAAHILPADRGRGSMRRHRRGIHRSREKLLRLQAQIPKRHFEEMANRVFLCLKEGSSELPIAA